MTSTGKKARRRWGTRFAAKAAGSGAARSSRRERKQFGKLPFSCERGNVPQAAVDANDALVARAAQARRAKGYQADQNVAAF